VLCASLVLLVGAPARGERKITMIATDSLASDIDHVPIDNPRRSRFPPARKAAALRPRWTKRVSALAAAGWPAGPLGWQPRLTGAWYVGLWTLVAASAIAAAAVGSAVYLVRRQSKLSRLVREGADNRTRELAQLGSGLVHEIRNPLHALRINLHLLRRGLSSPSPLTSEQLVATIQDCDAAIDRLSRLMQDLLLFTDPHRGKPIEIDVSREVQATLRQLADELQRDEIEVRTQLTDQPVLVSIDPARLKQLTLHLLSFSHHRAGKRGTIEVEVACRGEQVELAVADHGPTLSDGKRAGVFEPFQAPAETGSGLGLALVQVFVEEAGGRVVCQRRTPAGNQFRLWLPLVHPTRKGGNS
jgi:signal transduction histidine kinase